MPFKNTCLLSRSFFLICAILLITSIASYTSISAQETSHIDSIKLTDSLLISVIGVGDIMLGTDFPTKNSLPPKNDCMPLLEPVKHILLDADITFGNLEGCFLNKGPVVKQCKDTTICYAFKMPEHFIDCLVESGFDVLSLANNHVGDFGDAGRNTTIRLLDSVGIHYGGLISHPTAIFESNGLKIGFCAFAPNRGTCNINDIPNVIKTVSNLKKKTDIVIVSFHGGAEGSNHRNVTRKTEIFYGENRGNVYEFARHVIDAGADIVFGHGPHVTRAIDLYKGRFIAYSLGNFATYGRFNLRGANGFAPIVKLYVDKNGKFVEGQIFPIVQEGSGGAKLDPKNQVITEIQRLIAVDFPESLLRVNDKGEIKLKE
ncbi:MAG: capsule biosynthesis protein CapA [Bacteroidetes bacterium HGW-Bacteroidetes-15]|nr:MAG: capsule biosynthesis protein CapA [Bacteroidetes bacterium HGW-Bacteroidetes-15]